MNREHLGDAFDHWKGSMFRWLKPALHDLHVVPMFTDDDLAARWSEAHIGFYARLLGVTHDRVLQPNTRFEVRKRMDYFATVRPDAQVDLFFDPDTGIMVDGRAGSQHVTPGELAAFLPRDSGRVVLVYQHAAHTKDYLRATLTRIAEATGLCGLLGYGAGSVAMICMARDEQRLSHLRRAMIGLPDDGDWIVTLDDVSPSSR